MTRNRARTIRILLISILAFAVLVLGGAVAVLLPILTHESAGGSGQRVPQGYVAETEAEGADGRTRSLSVETERGETARLDALIPGESIVVHGAGFDAGIGIYLAICAVPASPQGKPGPCLGGIPEGAEQGDAADTVLSSAWITDDWAWRSFATQPYDDAETGSFTTELTVPDPRGEGLDCVESRCAIATRADHTASRDRVQDMLLPVRFADG